MLPHLEIECTLHDLMGRRKEVLGPMQPVLIDTAVGLADQLSVYLDQRSWAKLKLRDVGLREGKERSYIFVGLSCGAGPLRTREVNESWDLDVGNDPVDMVWMVVARRWRFIDKYKRLLEDMFRRVGDQMVTYFERRPFAVIEPAPDSAVRIIEGVDKTFVVFEFDDRSETQTKDSEARHRLN